MFAEIFIDRNNVEAPLDLEKAIKLRSRYVLSGQKRSVRFSKSHLSGQVKAWRL